jgi:cell division protein FtsW (lipid II flippase)
MKDKKLRNLRIATISLLVIDFLVAIAAPVASRLGYSFLSESLPYLYSILIPLTSFFIIITFVSNIKSSYNEKRTKKQELRVRQSFWGRVGLLGLVAVIAFIYGLFRYDIIWLIAMFVLFFLAIILGPLFGRLIIRKL